MPFGGRLVPFPTGPAVLSMASGAPLLPTFIVRSEGGGYRVETGEVIRPSGNRDRQEAIRESTERMAAALEEAIRKHLDQWYCTVPYFEDTQEVLRCEP